MPGFWDNPMFTSPTNTPTVLRYPGTDGPLPQWPYSPPAPPATTATQSLPPTPAAFPLRPAAPPLLLAQPTPTPTTVPGTPPGIPQAATNNNMGPAFTNPLTNHAATLMALGAGIAQGGIGRGLAMASAAAENERNRQLQQLSLLQSYKALTDSGVPQQEAIAAVSNPSLMRTLAARYLGARAQMDAAGRSASALPANSPPLSATSPNGATAPYPGTSPVPGVRQASDGYWYAADPNRPGKYFMVH